MVLLSFGCLVTVNVLWLCLAVLCVGLQCVIVVFPDHAHLLFGGSEDGGTMLHMSRVPRLDLPVFEGDVLEWQSFWDSYESAIHTNQSFSNVWHMKPFKLYPGLQLKTALMIKQLTWYTSCIVKNTGLYRLKCKLFQRPWIPFQDYILSTIRQKAILEVLNHSIRWKAHTVFVPVNLKKLPDEIQKNIVEKTGH